VRIGKEKFHSDQEQWDDMVKWMVSSGELRNSTLVEIDS